MGRDRYLTGENDYGNDVGESHQVVYVGCPAGI